MRTINMSRATIIGTFVMFLLIIAVVAFGQTDIEAAYKEQHDRLNLNIIELTG